MFVGLLSNTPIWQRTDKLAEVAADIDEEDDGDNDSLLDMEEAGSQRGVIVEDRQAEPDQNRKPYARPRPRPLYNAYGTEIPEVDSDEGVRQLLDEEAARKEARMVAFFDDPEKSMKVFLSSYMRKEGLIWFVISLYSCSIHHTHIRIPRSDRNLTWMPLLLSFFFRFLIRNQILSEYERSLRNALQIVDLARKELPLTSTLAKLLPDNFSMACQECWGVKVDGYKRLVTADDEPKAVVDQFEEELKAANVEVIKTTEVAPSADDRTTDAAPATTIPDSTGNGWGDSNTWGNTPDTTAPTGPPPGDNPWAAPACSWEPPEPHSLIPLMGPTALPITHAAGVVEWSARRIKSITPPPLNMGKSPSADCLPEPDADGVEAELERRFAKVVLAPWAEWDPTEEENLLRPRILESSRGPVVLPSQGSAAEGTDASAVKTDAGSANSGGEKPHDMYKDDITVLVEPSVAASLVVGLGLGGTWVQMARQLTDENGEALKKAKKSKSKSKKRLERYWYIDELMLIIPSYYTV